MPTAAPSQTNNHRLIIFAWIIVALISALPDIAFSEITGSVPAWMLAAKLILLGILAVASYFYKPIKLLHNFFLIMIAFFGLLELSSRINFTIPFLQNLFGANVFDQRMQAEQTGKLAVSVFMILILFVLGYKRKDIFLTRGNLKALITPVKLLGFPKPEPWTNFGLLWSFCIAAGLGVALYLGMKPSSSLFVNMLPFLPSIIFYAALNAFNEEMIFRAPMLATLEPVAGSLNALWMAASFFGISHYFGVPSGIPGAIASVFMGWILSKAMLETRGLFWSWWIHLLSDIVIFSFLTMGLIK
ncbi:MAG: CPBP family intramembrane metalloprotease [Anaerolineae bacterium]|nr:CPBP family intramembrane metalloprotease [Anaerolineae bacterium]